LEAVSPTAVSVNRQKWPHHVAGANEVQGEASSVKRDEAGAIRQVSPRLSTAAGLANRLRRQGG
jgi:hypothetical protein